MRWPWQRFTPDPQLESLRDRQAQVIADAERNIARVECIIDKTEAEQHRGR